MSSHNISFYLNGYLWAYYTIFFTKLSTKKSARVNALFVLVGIYLVAHDGCATLTLSLFYGGGESRGKITNFEA